MPVNSSKPIASSRLKQKARHFPVGFRLKLILNRRLLHRCHSGAQAGFITGSSVLVDHALLRGFINHGDGAAKGSFDLFGIARLNGLAQFAQRGTQL